TDEVVERLLALLRGSCDEVSLAFEYRARKGLEGVLQPFSQGNDLLALLRVLSLARRDDLQAAEEVVGCSDLVLKVPVVAPGELGAALRLRLSLHSEDIERDRTHPGTGLPGCDPMRGMGQAGTDQQ